MLAVLVLSYVLTWSQVVGQTADPNVSAPPSTTELPTTTPEATTVTTTTAATTVGPTTTTEGPTTTAATTTTGPDTTTAAPVQKTYCGTYYTSNNNYNTMINDDAVYDADNDVDDDGDTAQNNSFKFIVSASQTSTCEIHDHLLSISYMFE